MMVFLISERRTIIRGYTIQGHVFLMNQIQDKVSILIRSGSYRKIAIEIIAQLRDGSMYLTAVQEVPYFNRN